ncbi:hypothetical protein Clacol_007112 [Clathrus columnatus]|uniref:Ubiquitin carboxyl-terminal hydrolase n=1 Tax=Clathrus columnatus TaxID=1419009 RepID=A0AAV5AIV9_9AGAM|nr:hypothetical protein Clacol_007112 [Clathrus columnatus]
MVKTNWMPLEANPESFNNLASKLGLDISQYSIYDVLGFDDELLALVPRPVKAAILLYPTPEIYDNPTAIASEEELKKRWPLDEDKMRKETVYIRQRLSNHCGTMALLHGLANTPSLPLADGPIKTLFNQCKGLNPEESATLLENTNISQLHVAAADLGQSHLDDPDDTTSHYLAFVDHNGEILEFDGWARSGAVSHGPIAIRGEGDFFKSVITVVKEMMASTGSIKYTLLVIAPAS